MNVGVLLELPALMAPEQPIISDGGRRLTFAELAAAAGRRSAALARLGVGPGDRVGIFAVNSIDVVELLFATVAVGAVAVPMNFRAGAPEATHLVADSGVRVIYADARYAELIDEVRCHSVEHVVVFGSEADRAETSGAFDVSTEVDDDAVAILIYTSGTTALPKGVPLTHGALSALVLESGEVADGTEHGRTLIAVPLYHVAGLSALLRSVYGGRRVSLMAQFEPRAWMERVLQDEVTHAFLVPTMLAKVLAAPESDGFSPPSLQVLSYGAAPMPLTLIRRAIARFPGVGFIGAYGMSETTSTVSVLDESDHRVDLGAGEDDEKLKRLASVGRAVAGVEIGIATATREILPAGEVGEVCLRTARTMEGYWSGGDESGKGSRDASGWLHTGDLAYMDDDGYVFLVGRDSDMIIRAGENIAPLEIEEALTAHPDVVEAAVVGLPDEEWGERVEAAVVLRPTCDLHEADLLDLCRELASFKRPQRVAVLAELPQTSTGKLIRRDLIAMLSASRSDT